MKNKWWKNSGIWLAFGFIVSLIALASPYLTYLIIKNLNIEGDLLSSLAIAGDFLGGTTFLLALASILFIITSILVQKDELELSRIELKASVDELKKSNDTMQLQQFETSFYNLLSLLKQVKSETIVVKNQFGMNEEVYEEINIIDLFLNATNIDSVILPSWFIGEYFNLPIDDVVLFEDMNEVHMKLTKESILGEIYTFEDMGKFYKEIHSGYTNNYRMLQFKHLKKINQIGLHQNHFVRFYNKNHKELFREVKFEVLTDFKNEYNHAINPFVETYKSIISLVLKHIPIEDRNFYFDILRAQLKKHEFEVITFIRDAQDDVHLQSYIEKYPELGMFTRVERIVEEIN